MNSIFDEHPQRNPAEILAGIAASPEFQGFDLYKVLFHIFYHHQNQTLSYKELERLIISGTGVTTIYERKFHHAISILNRILQPRLKSHTPVITGSKKDGWIFKLP